jgi:hypothetical protein
MVVLFDARPPKIVRKIKRELRIVENYAISVELIAIAPGASVLQSLKPNRLRISVGEALVPSAYSFMSALDSESLRELVRAH